MEQEISIEAQIDAALGIEKAGVPLELFAVHKLSLIHILDPLPEIFGYDCGGLDIRIDVYKRQGWRSMTQKKQIKITVCVSAPATRGAGSKVRRGKPRHEEKSRDCDPVRKKGA